MPKVINFFIGALSGWLVAVPPKGLFTDPHQLRKSCNNAVMYDDGSYIDSIDPRTNVITIKIPGSKTKIELVVDKWDSVSADSLRNFKEFNYGQRLLSGKQRAQREKSGNPMTIDDIARHDFARRVDQMINLYGRTTPFKDHKGNTIKNLVLVGKIILPNGKELRGAFEYGFFLKPCGDLVLYHKFLRPESKTS